MHVKMPQITLYKFKYKFLHQCNVTIQYLDDVENK